MSESIKHTVVKLMESGEWFYGGALSRQVAPLHECKESVVDRRLREMSSDKDEQGNDVIPTLDKRLIPNPKGKGAPVVQYRLKPSPVVLSNSISQLRLV